MLRIGMILAGFCAGYFGSNSFEDKRVEAIGVDWVVAREIESDMVFLYTGQPEFLMKFIKK